MKNATMRQEFTANVSHELKTPLTSISGFAELMKAGDMAEETVLDFSKSIYDEAQRLISLVNDIIKISELDEGNISYEQEKVDLYEIIQGDPETSGKRSRKKECYPSCHWQPDGDYWCASHSRGDDLQPL